ncbi:MAG: GNAT family N-acetyltransferase [Candidatus Thorarchaeota archaeon]
MVNEGRIEVDFASDWNLYSEAWNSSMQQYYWYRETPVFDFNKNEELDEMRSDFEKHDNLFLVARYSNYDKIIGILGLRYSDPMARIRRWEPAVVISSNTDEIRKALLRRAMEHLASIGVKRIGYLLKHPVNSPDTIEDLSSCFMDLGFEKTRPDSVDLIMPLDDLFQSNEPPIDVTIETGENFTYEDLASITVKSFTSTPEEREIHGFDKTVTEYIQATSLMQRIAEGFYGPSPDEFRKVAVVDGVPAGFLGAFAIESKYKPLTGVLGPMAVLPSYRRRGIASYLISESLISLRNHGCEYAAVGTPAKNLGAIRLYQKVGFQLACRLITLEKDL